MLTTAVIVFGAGCVLFAAYAILSYQCKQRLAAVRDEVAEQRERKVQKAEGLDVLLARAISEGKHATGQLIEGWQKRRAEILTCGKTGQPWAWDEEDLAKWAKQIQDQPWDESFIFFKHEEEGKGPKLAARFLELAAAS